jgi:hypothetical protein
MDLYQSLVFAGSVQVPKPGPTREAQWTATDMVKGSVNSADKMEEWQEASSTQATTWNQRQLSYQGKGDRCCTKMESRAC